MRVRGLIIVAWGILGVAPVSAHAAVALSTDTVTSQQLFFDQPLAEGTDANEAITAGTAFDSGGKYLLTFSGVRGSFTATSPCSPSSANQAVCPFRTDTTIVRGRIRMQGGDDRVTGGVQVGGAPSTAVEVDLGAGDDVVVPGSLDLNPFGRDGDDTIDTGDQTSGFLAGDSGQDLIATGVAGPVNPGTGSDVLAVTGPGSRAPAVVPVGNEPQVLTIDGLCNDGGPQDTSRAGGPSRSIGGVSCESNGVDRDNLGSRRLALNGGILDDSLTGSPGDDTIAPGRGNDTLAGEGGADFYIAGEQDDTILARDGIADRAIRCGDGIDRAVVDPVDPVEPDCETIERGAPGTPGPVGGGEPVPPDTPGVPPEASAPTAPQQIQPSTETGGSGPGGGDNGNTPPEVKMADQVGTVRKGRVELRVVCVYRAQECEGTIELSAAKQVKKGDTKLRRGAPVGDASISIPWGTDEAVRVPLSGKAKSLLNGGRKISADAKVEATDSAADGGAVGRATAKVQLGGRAR